tara:strand:- start:2842 stop:3972 length:1131 start_codon:yes stop_codon:yes gene_type:complete
MGSKVTAILVWVSALFMYPSVVVAEKLSTINLPAPNTAIASEMYDLHLYVMYICVVIFIGVFGTMFYSVVNHRKSKGYKAANFHHSTTVEIIWTAVPVLILIGMGYPATKTVVDMKDTSAPEITIKATGYQWMWGYDYLTGEGEGISFFSRSSTPREQIRNEAPKGEHYILEVDNNVVVPVGKKVRILTTANDVIHAWSVQQLGVKQDAIPGYIRDTWFKAEKPGIYRGVCSELCGKEHAYMPIVVEVMEQEKYTQWVAAQAQTTEAAAADANKEYTMDELKAKGEKVYAGMCAACHQATGKGIPGTFPALDGSKIATGPKADHINIVVNGKDGSAMSSYKHLSDLDLAAVITYERNSWSNKTDIVQPSEIKAFRN